MLIKNNDITYAESKNNDTNELIYNTETDSQTWRRNLWFPAGWGAGGGELGSLG